MEGHLHHQKPATHRAVTGRPRYKEAGRASQTAQLKEQPQRTAQERRFIHAGSQNVNQEEGASHHAQQTKNTLGIHFSILLSMLSNRIL